MNSRPTNVAGMKSAPASGLVAPSSGQRMIESSLDRFQIISARLHMKEINDANHDFLICSHR